MFFPSVPSGFTFVFAMFVLDVEPAPCKFAPSLFEGLSFFACCCKCKHRLNRCYAGCKQQSPWNFGRELLVIKQHAHMRSCPTNRIFCVSYIILGSGTWTFAPWFLVWIFFFEFWLESSFRIFGLDFLLDLLVYWLRFFLLYCSPRIGFFYWWISGQKRQNVEKHERTNAQQSSGILSPVSFRQVLLKNRAVWKSRENTRNCHIKNEGRLKI